MEQSSSETTSVPFLEYVCVDMYAGEHENALFVSKKNALAHIRKVNTFPPTFTIETTEGYQIYWKLKTPVQITEEKVEEILGYHFNLAVFYGGKVLTLEEIISMTSKEAIESHKSTLGVESEAADSLLGEEIQNLISMDLYPILDYQVGGENKFYKMLFGVGLGEEAKIEERMAFDQEIITLFMKKHIFYLKGSHLPPAITLLRGIFDAFPTSGLYKKGSEGEKYTNDLIAKNDALCKSKEDKLIFGESFVDHQFGYFFFDKEDTKTFKTHISNFIIKLNKLFTFERKGERISFYDGYILMSGGKKVLFDRMDASILESRTKLRNFLSHRCGTQFEIYDVFHLVQAIKALNKGVIQVVEIEYGYNKTKGKYLTSDLLISKDGVFAQENLIKYSDLMDGNRLGFKELSEAENGDILRFISEEMLRWNSPKVMLPSLAFALYPIIYPHLAEVNKNKFYLLLYGKSGGGKSSIATWCQRFYGGFHNLMSWTSTDTSMSVKGTAYKDALLVIDDMKKENFRDTASIRNAMAIIQNYADGTSRERSSTDLFLSDNKTIKGHLMLTGEHIVFTEESTIARGICIKVNQALGNSEEISLIISRINEMSDRFSGIMPEFIRYVLKECPQPKLVALFSRNRENIRNSPLIEQTNKLLTNFSRSVNNFAALKTSWDVLSEYFKNNQIEMAGYDQTFETELYNLINENLERVNRSKQEIRFEEAMWRMFADKELPLVEIRGKELKNPENIPRDKIVGYFITGDERPRIYININRVYGTIASSLDSFTMDKFALIDKLHDEGKIDKTMCMKFSVNGIKRSGRLWLGAIPKGLLYGAVREDKAYD